MKEKLQNVMVALEVLRMTARDYLEYEGTDEKRRNFLRKCVLAHAKMLEIEIAPFSEQFDREGYITD